MTKYTENIFSNKKAVFFDMDGVLFDSMPNHEISWLKTLNSVGIKYSAEKVYLNEGRTGRELIKEAFAAENRPITEPEVQELYEKKTKLFRTLPKAKPVTGIKELIDSLDTFKIECFIVTGSSQKKVLDRIPTVFGTAFKPNNKVTGLDVTNGKPDPEPYLKALELSNLNKEEVVIIENAPLGIISGREAGIKTVAINTGILSEEILINAGASKVYPNATALLEEWKNYIK